MGFFALTILLAVLAWIQLPKLWRDRHYKDFTAYCFMMVAVLYAGWEFFLTPFHFRLINSFDIVFKPIGKWLDKTLQ